MAAPAPSLQRGIVKQILSGDAVVIRGQPRGGPPPERTLCLSNITAPRMARRANPNFEGSTETKDEPYAWEAREFVRKKLIGKEVVFTVEYQVPGTGREYGCIYLGKDASGENLTEALVSEGLVEVRRGGIKPGDESQQRLVDLEEAAKGAGKGKWSAGSAQEHIRDVTWNIENPRQFVDSHHGKPIEAVIEHIRDGCTVRAFLIPSFHHVTVMLSGIKAPMFKMDGNKQTPDEYAEEAKFFVEARLLQRDVKIILEGVSNQNLLGSVLHPNGNIAELLLKEGFARCVDWSMGVVSQGPEKLRAAEKLAKEKKTRIWKNYLPKTSEVGVKDKQLTGKVVEVVNGDSLVVKTGENTSKKIFLASIRPPRPVQSEGGDEGETKKKDSRVRSRPLYDIPYMFEAREFLRKKLIGKKVNITIDYIQPPNQGFPEKTCCTVMFQNINVAEALVSRGLATVVRYRQDDDKRSSCYDVLLSAEERARKKSVGVHSKKDNPTHRVADISGDVTKAKQFLPFLQRAGRSEAIVEFVASGSRFRLFIPRETCLITFLLAGIECPRAGRPGPGGLPLAAEPFGEDAMNHSKEICLQREVEVEVEAMDKGGNFIGWMWVDNSNLSIGLVEAGLAKVHHFTAERSNYYSQLSVAENSAKAAKLKRWENFEEPKEVEVTEEPGERKVNYKTVLITEVTEDFQFYTQNVDSGPQLEKLMEQLRADMQSNPPLPGAFTPKKGEMCAAKFSQDNEWYRAKVQKISGSNIEVLFIDYGNREKTTAGELAVLPPTFHTLPPQASLHALACVTLPPDEEGKQEAIDALYNDIINKQCLLNPEYSRDGTSCVSLAWPDSQNDIANALVADGLVLVEPRREKRLAKLMATYIKSQDKAKAERKNLWRYGDFTEDDAKEFGYNN